MVDVDSGNSRAHGDLYHRARAFRGLSVCKPHAMSGTFENRMKRVLTSGIFWIAFIFTGGITALFFAWEIDLLSPLLPGPVRVPVNTEELLFTTLIVLFIAFNAGLFAWQRRNGSCPSGVRRATGVSTVFGGLALLCPVCTAIPFTLIGLSISFGFLIPFLPLLRMITVLILATVLYLLWPRNSRSAGKSSR